MPKHRKVTQGDCLASIAAEYGFVSFAEIWEHPGNAGLRAKRGNPNVLMPGDTVYIPDVPERVEGARVTAVNPFRLPGEPVWLRLRLTDATGSPLAGEFAVTVGAAVTRGAVGPDGRIEVKVPADARMADLALAAAPGESWTLQLGGLHPAEYVCGVQARLNNLGYDSGPVDGIQGPITRTAIKAFQRDHPPLAVDGVCGPKTRAVLLSEHGC